MCESGLAEEIKVGNKKTRYEQRYGHGHHDHLICLKCGEFTEVNDSKIERLQDKLAEANDFTPLRHKLEIYGLCKKCK
jgi:Fur family ferric uptake transcriptional regulator